MPDVHADAARRLALIGAVGAGAGPLGATAQGADKAPVFLAGAASADITPPPWTAASDAAFVPACGPTADAVSTLWPGERRYQFEEPYVNGFGPDVHRFTPGDSVYEAPEKNVGVGNSGRARREVAGARSDRQSYVNFGA